MRGCNLFRNSAICLLVLTSIHPRILANGETLPLSLYLQSSAAAAAVDDRAGLAPSLDERSFSFSDTTWLAPLASAKEVPNTQLVAGPGQLQQRSLRETLTTTTSEAADDEEGLTPQLGPRAVAAASSLQLELERFLAETPTPTLAPTPSPSAEDTPAQPVTSPPTFAPTPAPTVAPTQGTALGANITELWGLQIGSSGGDTAYAAVRDGSSVVFVGSYNASAAFAIAADADTGEVLWGPVLSNTTTSINGSSASSSSESVALAVAASSSLGVVATTGYATGDLFNASVGSEDLFVLLLDSGDGAVVAGWQGGSAKSDKAYGISFDGDGDLIVGGGTYGALCNSSSATAAEKPFVARLSTDAVTDGADFDSAALWCVSGAALTGGGTGGVINGLSVNSDGGNITVVGTSTSSPFAARLSVASGEAEWVVDISADTVTAVAEAADGGAFVVGYTNGTDGTTVLALKLDPNGSVTWTYGSSRSGNSSAASSDNSSTAVAGFALGVAADGDSGVLVTGIDLDSAAFVLQLDSSDGTALCYFSFAASDAAATTGRAVTAGGDGSGSSVTVSGSTAGSLAGGSSGGDDAFTIALDMEDTDVCPEASTDGSAANGGFIGSGTGSTTGTATSIAVAVAGIATIAIVVTGGGAAAGGGAGAAITAGGTTTAVAGSTGTTQVSPTSSMGGLMVGQIQFMATLALVDSGGQSPAFSEFSGSVAWTNLWVGADGVRGCVDEEQHGVGGRVFVGNTVLAFLGLLVVFFLHMLLVSAVEAYWLASDAATMVAEDARRQGVTVEQLDSLQVVPHNVVLTRCGKGIQSVSVRGNFQKENGESHASDGNSGPATPENNRTYQAGSDAPMMAPADAAGEADLSRSGHAPAFESAANSPVPPQQVRGIYRFESRNDPYDHVLNRSHSIWLFWPHVELLYLLFIFDGALTAQASMFRSNCLLLKVVAVVLFVLFPVVVLWFVWMVCRHRVRSHTAPVAYVEEETDGAGVIRRLGRGWRGAIVAGESFLAPFERGHWESAAGENASAAAAAPAAPDDRGGRKADEFRVGFEPLYAEYTRKAVYYIVFRLVKALSMGLVAALVDGAMLQAALLCGIHLLDLIVLLVVWPFSNVAVNIIEAILVFIDAASMAVLLGDMVFSSPSDAAARHRTWDIIMMMQIGALVFITIPLYIDTGLTIFHTLRKKVGKAATSSGAGGEGSARSYRSAAATNGDSPENQAEARAAWAKRRAKHTWFRYLGVMVRRNLSACAGNTTHAVVPTRRRAPAQVANAGSFARSDFENGESPDIPSREASATAVGTPPPLRATSSAATGGNGNSGRAVSRHSVTGHNRGFADSTGLWPAPPKGVPLTASGPHQRPRSLEVRPVSFVTSSPQETEA